MLSPSEALESWAVLNAALMAGDEAFARSVLRVASRRKDISVGFLRRIHSRINRLRAMRERSTLAKRSETKPRNR
jgi:hypothetical protein